MAASPRSWAEMMPVLTPDPIALETHRLVTATFVLAVITAAAIVVPIVAKMVRNARRNNSEAAKAMQTVETITAVLQGRLQYVASKNVSLTRVAGGSVVLISQLLDPQTTRYLPRGLYDALIHAAYHTYGVLERAPIELPANQAVIDHPLSDTNNVKLARRTIDELSEMAVAGVVMLRAVRRRIASGRDEPFIDWDKERELLSD